jgi:hypothetical protein
MAATLRWSEAAIRHRRYVSIALPPALSLRSRLAVGSTPMNDSGLDEPGERLKNARRRLWQANHSQSVERERVLVREVAGDLEAAAEGLLEATGKLCERVNDLEERSG